MRQSTRISTPIVRAARVWAVAAPLASAVVLLALLPGGAAGGAVRGAPAPVGAAAFAPAPTPSPTPTPTPTPPPIAIQPDSGLSAQFGYAPPFTRNIPTFDSADRPYIRSRSGDPDYTGFVQILRDGTWKRLDLLSALRAAYPNFLGTQGAGGGPAAQIVLDTADRAYTLVTVRLEGGGLRNVMLWSTDACVTWRVVELPAGDVVSETWTGHNVIDGPPLLLVSRVDPALVNPDTGKLQRTLYLTRPYFSGDGIVIPALTQISARALGVSDGATTASAVATHGDLSWIVWADSTPRPAQGSPVYVVTYDRRTQALGRRVLLAWTQPGNDGHAQPGIVIDSKGYLHVIAGAHGRPFQYRQSLVPYTAYEGWSQLEPVGTTGYADHVGAPQEGCMTYLAFVCDQQDRLHVAYRQWRRNTDTWFNGALFGALSYQRHDAETGWTSPRPLVIPPYKDYSIYAQALSLDHRGHLYLSASCMAGSEGSTRKAAMERWRQAGSEGPQPPLYVRRMVLVSVDGGDNWRFAATEDFAPGAPD